MGDVLTEGKKPGTLNPYNASDRDACFVNQRVEGGDPKMPLEINGKEMRFAVFYAVGFKNVTFTKVVFEHGVFINCYFRGVTFRECDFTGCHFTNCNFPAAKFINCKLEYSSWKETLISSEELFANIS